MSAYPTIGGWEVPEPREPMTALDWAEERLANSKRIALYEKAGADRDSWLEDVAYWQDIVRQLQRLASLEAGIGEIVKGMRIYGNSAQVVHGQVARWADALSGLCSPQKEEQR